MIDMLDKNNRSVRPSAEYLNMSEEFYELFNIFHSSLYIDTLVSAATAFGKMMELEPDKIESIAIDIIDTNPGDVANYHLKIRATINIRGLDSTIVFAGKHLSSVDIVHVLLFSQQMLTICKQFNAEYQFSISSDENVTSLNKIAGAEDDTKGGGSFTMGLCPRGEFYKYSYGGVDAG